MVRTLRNHYEKKLQKFGRSTITTEKATHNDWPQNLCVLPEKKYKLLATFEFKYHPVRNDGWHAMIKTWELIQDGAKIQKLEAYMDLP